MNPEQDWRQWNVTLHRDEDKPTHVTVHACTEPAAMTVVRYLLDAEQRTHDTET